MVATQTPLHSLRNWLKTTVGLMALFFMGGHVHAQTYCTVGANSPGNAGIIQVTFNTINNSSASTSGYTDFTGETTTVLTGSTYQLSVMINATGSFLGSDNNAKAWIDWNQNGTFEASEQYSLGKLKSGYLSTDVSGAPNGSPKSITVPANAVNGITRMRIRTRQGNANFNMCGNMNNSEAEDYTIVVTTLQACSGTPYPGNTTSSHIVPCTNSDFTLGIEYPSTDTGLSYQWESSTTGASGPFASNGLGTAITQVTSASVATWYRVVVTCAGNPGPSVPIKVTPSANGAACYCAATANSNNDYGINNVTFNTINHNSGPLPAYSDFSSFSTKVYAGETYPLSVTANVQGFDFLATKAWIDWNLNGTFESSESYDLGINSFVSGPTSGSPLNVTVPLNAVGGRTIMRVRTASGILPPAACGNANDSEAEDYTLIVVPVHNTCATAFQVECGDTFWGKTTGVAHSMPANACPFNGAASTGGQNWWKYVATTDEAVTFSTCGTTTFDTRISIFSGADCTNLSCVSMNDDNPGCVNGSSTTTINTVTGNTYWIAVHGAGATAGTYELSVSCAPVCAPPANDGCASATPLTTSLADGFGVPAAFTNVCATVDAPTSSSGTMPVQGVWYTFNSGAYDHALITLEDNEVNSQYSASTLSYALFTGDCAGMGADQIEFDMIDAAGTNVVTVTPNTDYRMLVFNTGGSGVAGTFGMMVEYPAHDDAAFTTLITPEAGLYCSSTMAPQITLLNNGDNNLTSVQINYGLSGGVNHTYTWTGDLAYGASVNLTLPTVAAEPGLGQIFTVATSLPNGQADGIPANDSQSVSLDVGGEGVQLVIMTDATADDFSWAIYSDASFATVASGGGYAANTLITENLCLSTDDGNDYFLILTDNFGDGLCCDNGNGYWELRTPQGGLLMRDLFDAGVDNSPTSPVQTPANPNYGYGHKFSLPAGPGNIAPSECGIFNNMLGNKVYANKVVGASNYQFEFSDPDAGFMRRIARPYNYVHFWDMVTNPLVPGVKYFARVRTDRDGPMLQAHFGKGCEMGLSLPLVVTCTQLIKSPAYGHSCNEVRSFNTNNSFIYAKPVQGATQYKFRIFNAQERYDQTFTRSTYILQLKWYDVAPLIDGYTYAVEVSATVNGVDGPFCTSECNITIDNGGNRPEASMVQAMEASSIQAAMWPNPVRDGQVNLNLSALQDPEQQITVAIQDIQGKQMFAREFGNSGERFNTVLDLPSSIPSGIYMVSITVNGERTVQRLSIIR